MNTELKIAQGNEQMEYIIKALEGIDSALDALKTIGNIGGRYPIGVKVAEIRLKDIAQALVLDVRETRKYLDRLGN